MVPMKGADSDIINQFITSCILPPFVIVVVFMVIFCFKHKSELEITFRDKKSGKEIKGTISTIFRKIILAVSVIAFIISYNITAEQMGIKEYLETYNEDSLIFDQYYVNPGTLEFTFPSQKRNLIYILGINGNYILFC